MALEGKRNKETRIRTIVLVKIIIKGTYRLAITNLT